MTGADLQGCLVLDDAGILAVRNFIICSVADLTPADKVLPADVEIAGASKGPPCITVKMEN